jgi:hypothetical protein
MRSLRHAVLAILTLLAIVFTASPALAAGNAKYNASTTNGSSSVLIVNGGTTTLYPGQTKYGSHVRLRPGQYIYYRPYSSLAFRYYGNHSTTTSINMTIPSGGILIAGSSYY